MSATASSTAKVAKKKTKKDPTYNVYLRKLLNDMYPKPDKVGMSSGAMEAVNGILVDLQERLGAQAIKLAKYQKKATLGTRHVHTAATLVMPPDLATHAMKDGATAVAAYAAAVDAEKRAKKR
tara:strand:- start:1728 stop:2096 length:369 start_codon:yes stop_codon:yes gene_type:complete